MYRSWATKVKQGDTADRCSLHGGRRGSQRPTSPNILKKPYVFGPSKSKIMVFHALLNIFYMSDAKRLGKPVLFGKPASKRLIFLYVF